MKTITFTLLPNKTMKVRWGSFESLDDKKILGVMAVFEKSTDKSELIYARRYAISELAKDVDGGRRFKISKPVNPDADQKEQDQFYHALIHPSPRLTRCECRGYHATGRCTHADAIAELCRSIPALPAKAV